MKARGHTEASRYIGIWGIRLAIASHAVLLLLLIHVWRLAARAGSDYFMPFLFSVGFAVLAALTYAFFVRPYHLAERMLRVFSGGYTMEGFENLRWRLSPGGGLLIWMKLLRSKAGKVPACCMPRGRLFFARQRQRRLVLFLRRRRAACGL